MKEDLAWQIVQNLRPSLITDTQNEIEAFTILVQAQESRLAELPASEQDSLREASAVQRRLRTAIPTAVEKPFIPVGSLRIRPGTNEDDT
ncbi:hypothetical protein [Arthrobacter sp. SO3]|uniref:hypothetical protein n=1 Tax=Arthrobacter sp. SO3 TaxID=1897057 RepID=UPI001CFF8DB9|nr:hypothetical protein [Arthrobacter sp. SO3]MCB5291809.1 hypothetical protein [Arthrobacter sp. SO3]